MLKRKIFFNIGRLFSFFVATHKPLTESQIKGKFAEDAAVGFLKSKNHKIIIRNWRAGKDEIDIISKDRNVLVFVEVRARAYDALVSGYHSVGTKKKKALLRVCKAYLASLKIAPKHFRFDVVEVRLGPKQKIVMINHYENVSLFSKHYLAPL